jgi:hypothetical protein
VERPDREPGPERAQLRAPAVGLVLGPGRGRGRESEQSFVRVRVLEPALEREQDVRPVLSGALPEGPRDDRDDRDDQGDSDDPDDPDGRDDPAGLGLRQEAFPIEGAHQVARAGQDARSRGAPRDGLARRVLPQGHPGVRPAGVCRGAFVLVPYPARQPDRLAVRRDRDADPRRVALAGGRLHQDDAPRRDPGAQDGRAGGAVPQEIVVRRRAAPGPG